MELNTLETMSISELVLWKGNYRHGLLKSEDAIIKWYIANYAKHMYALGQDIIEHEAILDPPIVVQEDNGYVVYDGNRRCSVMRLLLQPELSSNDLTKKRFQKLHDDNKALIEDLAGSIQVLVVPDESEAKKMIDHRHNGTQEGRGVIEWSPTAKGNSKKDQGEKPQNRRAFLIHDFLRKGNMLQEVQKDFDDRLTTWGRYFGFLADYFPLTEDSLTCKIDKASLEVLLKKIYEKMQSSDLHSHTEKKDFEKLIQPAEIVNTAAKPWLISDSSTEISLDSVRSKSKSSEKPLITERKTIIGSGHEKPPEGASEVTKQIFNELSHPSYIKIESAPYSSGAALRVLIESIFYDATKEESLKKGFSEAIDMYRREEGDRYYADSLTSQKESTIKLLHIGAHAGSFRPTSLDLKQLWENLSKLVVFCFEYINKFDKPI